MSNLENEIKRKIKIRKFAIDNLGTNTDTDGADKTVATDNGTNKLFQELYDNIQGAEQSRIQDGYSSLANNRKLGKLIIFTKRVVRKLINVLLGWYIRPILDKQTFFNGKTVNSIDLIRQLLIIQQGNNDQKTFMLETRINDLEKQDLNQIINQSVSSLKNEFALINQSVSSLKSELAQKIDELNDIKEVNRTLIRELGQKTKELEKIKDQNVARIAEFDKKIDFIFDKLHISCDLNLIQEDVFDYFKFENEFRGSREGVKEIQSVYVPYFKDKNSGRILDIGCGRGEFLELMRDNEIKAYGVDSYKPFVDYCRKLGFNVIYGDALTHLNEIEDCSLGGIFMSQVVEHLSNNYLITLINTAYKKLIPGSYFILETPNPDCLAAISEFNIDMSHTKPVHYKTLEFLFKEANYSSIERYH
ncbi:methyltransferase domain-containing protein, partial [Globicatella sulfidifaciens]